ncbi:MAG TPA: cation-transporting P-type ATPase, partial [Pseudonocardiaceae bacterium]|nr:cation-transporting P-type ATPase [Pseudonocardiaceae bacterium]
LYAGTFVVKGAGTAVVVAIGAGTRLAGIAAVTGNARRPRSPLATQLHRIVTVVAVLAIAVGVVFFGVALLLGTAATAAFLFAIGVTVALVPEGLLPTVTLSLSRAAQRMARRHALVRRLEAVETLGATTFVCTDKTGTLTRNEMSVVRVWTPAGAAVVEGAGYDPAGAVRAGPPVCRQVAALADSAARCAPDARAVRDGGRWRPIGDPMEVALHVLAGRAGVGPAPAPLARNPFDPQRRRSSVLDAGGLHVLGGAEAVLPRCRDVPAGAGAAVADLTDQGLRVLAVAHGAAVDTSAGAGAERDLRLLGLVGLQDPPRDDVAEAIGRCRAAGIRLAMVTGDHPRTAAAIAEQVGLLGPDRLVVQGSDLPAEPDALGALLDRDGVVVARVTPEDKLRIAQALQRRGHVVAMTGDGVNDGPALRAADIGIAMGASGTDVAREAADLVLLDDHFGTIVGAIELGRATSANIRRFLTYHLTDNVAELTPFVVWALSGGSIPLAITVLQVLALDIGTDLLPALALGAEPPSDRTMRGPTRKGPLLDGAVLRRAFGVLGPAEAVTSMLAFLAVLVVGGWTIGRSPPAGLLATASGTAFATIVLGQLANTLACRSQTAWVGRIGFAGNPLLGYALASEAAMLLVFLTVPPLPQLLGGGWPGWLGWLLAAAVVPVVLAADTADKALRAAGRGPRTRVGREQMPSSGTGHAGQAEGAAPPGKPAAEPGGAVNEGQRSRDARTTRRRRFPT